jgi:hypothetical protein
MGKFSQGTIIFNRRLVMTGSRTFLAAVLTLAILGILGGCKDQTASPEAASPNQQGFDYAFADDQLSVSASAGIAVDASAGLFSLGWRQIIVPDDQSAVTRGDAMVVAFDGTQPETSPFRTQSGVDIGTVYIHYAGNQIELAKKGGDHRGTFYSLFPLRPKLGETGLQFIPGGTYEFEVTGSKNFTPVSVSLTAPQSLLKISSPGNGDGIDVSSELTVSWSGGTPAGSILVRAIPCLPPPEDGGGFQPIGMPAGDNNGARGGPGWRGPGGLICLGGSPHGGPLKLPEGFVEKLDSNPGTFTIPGSALQELIADYGATRVGLSVSQISPSTFEHDGTTYDLLLRNSDQVVLSVN